MADGINKHVLSGVSKNLDKLDMVVEIKTSMDCVSAIIDSIGRQVKDLEYVRDKIRDVEHLSRKFKDLDQRLSASIKEIGDAQIYQQRCLE